MRLWSSSDASRTSSNLAIAVEAAMASIVMPATSSTDALLTSSSFALFFFNDTATTEIYTWDYTLSLHDALPILQDSVPYPLFPFVLQQFPSDSRTVVRSEEHTSELQSQSHISYAVFCLQKKRRGSGEKRSPIKRRDKSIFDRRARRRGLQVDSLAVFFFNDSATTEIYT